MLTLLLFFFFGVRKASEMSQGPTPSTTAETSRAAIYFSTANGRGGRRQSLRGTLQEPKELRRFSHAGGSQVGILVLEVSVQSQSPPFLVVLQTRVQSVRLCQAGTRRRAVADAGQQHAHAASV